MNPEWKYHVTIEREDWPDIQQWCKEYLGKFDESWYKLGIDPADYIVNGWTRTTWYFKTEEDFIWFILRWA